MYVGYGGRATPSVLNEILRIWDKRDVCKKRKEEKLSFPTENQDIFKKTSWD